MFAYEFNGYWKDVGTLGSYWEANMELVDIIPEFNLYEEYWKIYTKNDAIEPLYIAKGGHVERSIMGEGCECYGHVEHSVIGANVKIGRGAVIRDSIIMRDTEIGSNVTIDKSIIAENCKVGDNVTLGFGQEKPNVLNESIYSFGLVTIGEDSVIPDGVKIGKIQQSPVLHTKRITKMVCLRAEKLLSRQVTENEGNRNNFGRRQQ